MGILGGMMISIKIRSLSPAIELRSCLLVWWESQWDNLTKTRQEKKNKYADRIDGTIARQIHPKQIVCSCAFQNKDRMVRQNYVIPSYSPPWFPNDTLMKLASDKADTQTEMNLSRKQKTPFKSSVVMQSKGQEEKNKTEKCLIPSIPLWLKTASLP